jgi:hypothetical protein
MMAAGVVHGNDESVRAWQLFDQRIRQVRGERRDSAMARQVIPERSETPDLIAKRHAISWLAVGAPWKRPDLVFIVCLQKGFSEAVGSAYDAGFRAAVQIRTGHRFTAG